MAYKLELATKPQIAKAEFLPQLLPNLVLIYQLVPLIIGRVQAGVHAHQVAPKQELVAKPQIAKAEFHRQQFHSPALILQLVSHYIIQVGPNVRQMENKREV